MYSLQMVIQLVLEVGLLMLSAVVHEVAHGYVAHLCGDDTAREQGRLTLNPARHLDPVGSVALPLIMAMAGGAVFAYAKPVPYNPARLRNRRRDEVLVALAGPASNLVQALVGAGLFNLLFDLATGQVGSQAAALLLSGGPVLAGRTPVGWVLLALSTYVWVNLMLLFFNLVPLPPLDGSKVVCYFLKGEALRTYRTIQAYAMPIIIVVLYLLPSLLRVNPLGAYLDFTAGGVYRLLLGA